MGSKWNTLKPICALRNVDQIMNMVQVVMLKCLAIKSAQKVLNHQALITVLFQDIMKGLNTIFIVIAYKKTHKAANLLELAGILNVVKTIMLKVLIACQNALMTCQCTKRNGVQDLVTLELRLFQMRNVMELETLLFLMENAMKIANQVIYNHQLLISAGRLVINKLKNFKEINS